MTELAVIGNLSSYRTLADGTLRIVIDLDELQTATFHESFRINVAVAVARIKEHESSERGSRP
jgi:hypothetical protein